MNASTCTGTTKEGAPCRMRAVAGTHPATCFQHRPGTAADAARTAARSRGGRVHADLSRAAGGDVARDPLEGNPLATSDDIERALRLVARQTLSREISVRESQAATMALRVLLRHVAELEADYHSPRYRGDQ